MKKLLLVTAISSVLLTACGGSDSSSPAPVATRTIYVDGTAQPIATIVPKTRTADKINYAHRLKTGAYNACYQDAVMTEEACTTVDINEVLNDDGTSSYEVDTLVLPGMSGAVDIRVFHDRNEPSGSYTVEGSGTIGTSETDLTVDLVNTDWSFVTIDSSDMIDTTGGNLPGLKIIGAEESGYAFSTSKAGDYYYLYTNANYTVSIDLIDGNTLTVDNEQVAPNYHYGYHIQHNADDSIDFNIGDNWKEPLHICIGNDCADPITAPIIDESLISLGGATYTANDDGTVDIGMKPDSVTYIDITPDHTFIKGDELLKDINLQIEFTTPNGFDNDSTPETTIELEDSNGVSDFYYHDNTKTYSSPEHGYMTKEEFVKQFGDRVVTNASTHIGHRDLNGQVVTIKAYNFKVK